MRWQDLRGEWWTLPPELTKNGQPHEVYLSEQAADVLGWIEQSAVWVFPGRRDPAKARTNCGKAIDRLREEAGLAHFTAHDLRRTVATTWLGWASPAGDRRDAQPPLGRPRRHGDLRPARLPAREGGCATQVGFVCRAAGRRCAAIPANHLRGRTQARKVSRQLLGPRYSLTV